MATDTRAISPEARVRGTITAAMIDSLCATRPWTSLVAAILWLWVALLVLVPAAAVAYSFASDGVAVIRAIAWPLLAQGLLSVAPVVFLTRYNRTLRSLTHQRSEHFAAQALRYERRFWRVAAVMIAGTVITTGLSMIVAVVLR